MGEVVLLGRRVTRPQEGEDSADHAARLASEYALARTAELRRSLGQYFTQLPVARFMAALVPRPQEIRRILDPGAGTGILACALCEILPSNSGPTHVDAFEEDPELAAFCRASLTHARARLAKRGVELSYSVHESDFVLQNSRALTPRLFQEGPEVEYDVVIANPPYFKLQKSDARSVAAQDVVHGQPNIYALFMAISANLLAADGVMVTITPRSFTAGDYFRRFRQHLFAGVTPDFVHVFHSRSEAFRQDAVLQENVIMRCRRGELANSMVNVSSSQGVEDLEAARPRRVPLESVVNRASHDQIMHFPLDKTDDEILGFVRGWPMDFQRLGLRISTGPVVAFRAREFLAEERNGQKVAPLLWLQHVRPMSVKWPLPRLRKPQYLRLNGVPTKLLVPGASYVLLRRFSAKEERRRLVAAPLLRGQLGSGHIGLENHLNYIGRPDGELADTETVGLAALLNSTLLDRYFRVSSGSTQVNASEVRRLPLPSRSSLVALGTEIQRQSPHSDSINDIVADVLHVPRPLHNGLTSAG